ncbi:nicotinamide riboside transporter PnuC [Gluconobacter morbifer]|uniref:Nicotinamide riboside transporter PnuC n=1 Tax=Gluconobacter morbifer G707 TaxID=1088869 RepID=G6XJ88_9PROT|nr:nicotinamide riboside transporter PnuC [Gluconobacter morbifer]EHH68204.1 nicotinamide mononucleotide transporter [Gluconobacter morbifer G707]
MSLTELSGAVISALGVWLSAYRVMACWPVSLLASVLYGWIFFQAHLYADTTLQGVFCAGILYGWWCWRQDRDVFSSLPIRAPGTRQILWGVLAAAVGGTGWAVVLARCTDDPTPVMDAFLSSYSLLGQFWGTRRYRITWLLWIVIDVIYVGLFISRGLYPTAVLYAGFVLLAFHGFRQWTDARD